MRALKAPVSSLKAVTGRQPRTGDAIMYGAVEDGARMRGQIAHLDRSTALQRIAFLFQSLARRRGAAPGAPADHLDAVLGHEVIADATGLSRVRVSRTMKHLRDQNLVVLDGRRWRILDAAGLAVVGADAPA
ncbi:MAG: Crp/Fnr family transcriptional regulator [Oceanicaulis sp.]